jgi:hypothetical protein
VRPLPSTSALPRTLGVTATTCGRRSSDPHRPATAGGRSTAGRTASRRFWSCPGMAVMTLVPNWVNSPSTKRWMPSPIEVSRITAAMPTAMPSRVRKLRRRWAVMARRASCRESARACSVLHQGLHRIEPGGAAAGMTPNSRPVPSAVPGRRSPPSPADRPERPGRPGAARRRRAGRAGSRAGRRPRTASPLRRGRPGGWCAPVAPSALSRPISPVRWVTATSMTFITRMPATARLIAAMPATPGSARRAVCRRWRARHPG